MPGLLQRPCFLPRSLYFYKAHPPARQKHDPIRQAIKSRRCPFRADPACCLHCFYQLLLHCFLSHISSSPETTEPKIPYARIYTRYTHPISLKNTIYLYYKEIDVLPFLFTAKPPVKSGFFQEQRTGTEQAPVPFPSDVPLLYPFRLYILCLP